MNAKVRKAGYHIYERGRSFLVRLKEQGVVYEARIAYGDAYNARTLAFERALRIRELFICHVDALCRGIEKTLPKYYAKTHIKTYTK